MRTQVGIIGAGPAGLLLAHLLHGAGIDSVVLEARPRQYVENRIRAGVLEHAVAQLLRETGVGARMDRIGLPHGGTLLRFAGQTRRIDFQALTGKQVMVYSQHEVVRDLIAARLDAKLPILFDAAEAAVHDTDGARPRITFRHDGADRVLDCDVIAGCDGFHGICRPAFPPGALRTFERTYHFGWLGILAEAPPASEELVYSNHANGFALLSMRSPTVSRLYLQCAPDEDANAWSDDRIWTELHTRLADRDGFALHTGPILQKGVTAMRSFVAEPMRHGKLFLLGDAAHIVPPTGAKGLNTAAADAVLLARALERFFRHRDAAGIDGYSDACLRRGWKVQRFSWWMTSMLHRFPGATAFEARVQEAELDYVTGSRAASTALAENYVGLPLD